MTDKINNLIRHDCESFDDYALRLYANKDTYGLTCWGVANLLNKDSGLNKDESAWRKHFVSFKKGMEYQKRLSENVKEENQFEMIRFEKRELEKERVKVQTEKLEYNKFLRENARDEMIIEKIHNAIISLPPLNIPQYIKPTHTSHAYCLVFGDEHYGIEFEIKDLFGNIINAYSPEIFEKRMWILFNKTLEIIQKENIDTLNVYSMGDFSDGCLRVSQLMKLRCGVVDGTIKYADFITNWLNELTKYVRVTFQMTNGNHTELRQLGQPKGTFTEDNMGKVVKEFIKIRLKKNENFIFKENPTGYIYDNLVSNEILGIHGDVKNMERTLKDFSAIYGVPIQYLFAGHLHHSKDEEIGINSEVINVPSIVGVDPYAFSLNKTSNASGKLIVFDQLEGKVCEYTLKLN